MRIPSSRATTLTENFSPEKIEIFFNLKMIWLIIALAATLVYFIPNKKPFAGVYTRPGDKFSKPLESF
jgi:hypothetical protein